jgi:dipeptidyl aminopeptidase/acylaminoacyl peptidase
LPTDWSRDGRYLLFTSRDPKGGTDIWALTMDGSSKAFPVVQTAFEEQSAQFSPDAKWIAYQSDESGRSEVYVRRFPGPGEKWRISVEGGAQARWRSDGRELMYVSRSDRLMAVPITLPSSPSESPDIGTPVPLFTPPLGGAVQQGDFRHQYMLSPDGQRILVATVREPETAPITLILNWQPPR